MILFFLTSGLFLGWSLGANDASQFFGSAVGSKMVTFRKAAIIASIFVILGAVIQGSGDFPYSGETRCSKCNRRIIHPCPCCSCYNIYDDQVCSSCFNNTGNCRRNYRLELFYRKSTDSTTLSKIVATWISGPVIGAVFAIIVIYYCLNNSKNLLRFT